MYEDVPLDSENTVSISLINSLFWISFNKARQEKSQGLI